MSIYGVNGLSVLTRIVYGFLNLTVKEPVYTYFGHPLATSNYRGFTVIGQTKIV